ncbi:MAG: hypothetical protein A3J07_02990 [Candidatus Doudnabacteria bacterium RIFCSPLOWO2_02_FULL_49_13]|uniref:Uncharacterized protein n=1 Tax=Candidatus Doudnabacteria bacterium RIFCSPHIGHO2_12_FULL_48_16 TaxID=1817838 RepID=A0A1F5PLP2_9BACT|nr:MAG: hypothetical protein A3B77_01795 [Candidatus Doudnabacteria bacterium RIFCSPHIGHO2_02_FULL_49_24]OGE89458.1 MAG: hypothetical protein A2760_02480 [Candidatus Doudnabacteria bacterium RIFCSPHIGHO2_01_FULL_50_67]OGE90853.1 MAG: hypothetical protein A3E29_01640 [Candidatus Doudnabacteria bacterium RIFCSPHIGHO2_12_FULL_48_16]OGE97564.1 MAG: hypothetical protein A2990_02500 [Candidatus Doudnabacteria bacterium RIFCSPLOWO2_01_FULL_49_40]OGF03032.1 MAG: hypothetical protein A3J07_02990 [Candid
MIFEWAVRKKLFRNINHAIWFLMSVWLLLLTLAYYFYPDRRLIILLPLGIHLVALVQSSHATYIKKQPTETLSKDCIWFNAVMVGLYLILFFFLKYG